MKKGFTLIELLAVIIILAVIALIAIPTITGLIEKTEMNAAKISAYNLIKSAELSYSATGTTTVNGKLIYNCDGNSCLTSGGRKLDFKGKVPSNGKIIVNQKLSKVSELKINNYCVTGKKNSLKVYKGDCENEAGLYDEYDDLIVSWDELVNDYSYNIEYDATNSDEKGTFSYLLKTYDNLKKAKKIVVGNNVKRIGDTQFYKCDSLEEVVVGNNVTVIGAHAFDYSKNLKKVTLPEGLKTIWIYAFANCDNLSEIDIPSSVTQIDSSTFMSDKNLKNINISKLNKNYKSVDGVLFDYSMKTLMTYPIGKQQEEYRIPDGVTLIDMYAFFDSNLKKVTAPNSLKKISPAAFKECKNLSTIDLGTGLEEIGFNSFNSCNSLTNISFPASMKKIDQEAFTKCTSLKSASFEKTDGWVNSAYKPYRSLDVTDPAHNAEVFVEYSVGVVFERNQ